MPSVHLPCEGRAVHYASLAALDAVLEELQRAPRLPAAPLRALGDRPRLLVCHDFQGGYAEDAHAQGYTFEHWAFTDVFVYFSHQRVSPPPDAYVFAAHRHGTHILGTLIFEWDEARPDLRRLLDGPSPRRAHIREPLSYHYADALIDLAAARGFDGYLINVEVSLDVREDENVYLRKSDAMHNAARLRQWVAYLRSEGARRLPYWHVVWYDSVTYPHGQLAWQDILSPVNAPFFRAANAGFTNYTWVGQECDYTKPHAALQASARAADALKFARSNVYTGIDVFGRNCFGGHDTWKALELIGPGRARNDAQHLGLSVALFAPGWTWEHNPPRQGARTWDDWWADDCRLWLIGSHAIARHFTPQPVRFHGQFRTNFAIGAGHAWFVRGAQVDAGAWTDESVSAPKPELAWPSVQYVCDAQGERIDTSITTSLVPAPWSGNVALRVTLPGDARTMCVPLLALDVPNAYKEATVRVYVHGAVPVRACLLSPSVTLLTGEEEPGPNGWRRYTARTLLPAGVVHFGFAAQTDTAVDLRIGQIDVETAPAEEVYEAIRTGDTVQWPAFSSEGYELFSLDETAWLGTVHVPGADLPVGTGMVEVRRIGAWIEESVAYA
ncbi:mannosyl-glycoprotein endo-beta-N-acetylglucosaminidase [Malassezia brasiliensis]|uniref:Mannosyl-glycoprotein endo-beta-N-acetylglucosaminidase n=1 Tax=Malassezia brasiliensis TaxID=1821822 RepID=A0AAF0IME3_9BASI|nr:mannosyl-glycoprotein endo-beta-N-acetylglucosaminidase [Malassezia brasiliensis]